MNLLTHPRCIHAGRNRTDVHNRAFGGNDKGREGLCDANCAPDIDVVHVLGAVNVDVQGWHDDGLAGVVDEVVKGAACLLLDLLYRGTHAGSGCGFEGEEGDVGECQ